ncbi:MAG: hypothetical protein Q9214_007611 [Letrouitia sp. 1 TL-2023]
MRFTALVLSILYFTFVAAESMVLHSDGELVEASTEDDVDDGITLSDPLIRERGNEELVAVNGTHLDKRFNICKSSMRCQSCCARVRMGQLCNWAFVQIDEAQTYFTGTTRFATGVCQTSGSGMGCGIFVKRQKKIRKKECAISGLELKAYHNEIRKYGCQKCGRLPQLNEPGCEVHVDYVTGCRVRWLQPNMISFRPDPGNIQSRSRKPPKAKRTGLPEALEAPEAMVTAAGVPEPAEPRVTGVGGSFPH